MLTYGSVVWVNCIEKKGLTGQLRKVQRLALKMITGCMHSAPMAGMENLLGITAIEETIKASAIATCTRLYNTGYWMDVANETNFKSHMRTLNEIRVCIPELMFPQDRSTFKRRVSNSFSVRIGDRKEMTTCKIRPMPFDPGRDLHHMFIWVPIVFSVTTRDPLGLDESSKSLLSHRLVSL